MVRRGKRPGLREIALEAGVTVATVSRILSNQTKGFSVRPDVRERVMDAVKRFEYRPNVLAQSLRKKQMGIIGLLAVQEPLMYMPLITAGLLRALEPKGIALCSSYTSVPHPVQSLPPWRIDGAVVVSSITLEEVAPVERARIPYVALNGVGGPSAKLVSMDDTGGTRQAIEYLLRLGHQRIAYANVGGPYDMHVSVKARHDTYVQVLKEAGLSPMILHDKPMVDPPDDFVRTAVLEHKATAIIAYHSYMAVVLLQSLLRMSISVPRQVSLLSLGGGYPLEKLYPTITEVQLPFDKAGEIAGEMLVNSRHAKKDEPREVILPEKLIIRDSTTSPLGR